MAHVQLASFAQKSAKKIWSRPSHALASPLSCVRGSSTPKFLCHALPTSRIHNSLVISLNRCSARFCTTKATESKSSDANEASQVARIVATPSGSQYTASSDQLKALLIESGMHFSLVFLPCMTALQSAWVGFKHASSDFTLFHEFLLFKSYR